MFYQIYLDTHVIYERLPLERLLSVLKSLVEELGEDLDDYYILELPNKKVTVASKFIKKYPNSSKIKYFDNMGSLQRKIKEIELLGESKMLTKESLKEGIDWNKYTIKVNQNGYIGTIKRNSKGWKLYDEKNSPEEGGPFSTLESLMDYYGLGKIYLSGKYTKFLKETSLGLQSKVELYNNKWSKLNPNKKHRILTKVFGVGYRRDSPILGYVAGGGTLEYLDDTNFLKITRLIDNLRENKQFLKENKQSLKENYMPIKISDDLVKQYQKLKQDFNDKKITEVEFNKKVSSLKNVMITHFHSVFMEKGYSEQKSEQLAKQIVNKVLQENKKSLNEQLNLRDYFVMDKNNKDKKLAGTKVLYNGEIFYIVDFDNTNEIPVDVTISKDKDKPTGVIVNTQNVVLLEGKKLLGKKLLKENKQSLKEDHLTSTQDKIDFIQKWSPKLQKFSQPQGSGKPKISLNTPEAVDKAYTAIEAELKTKGIKYESVLKEVIEGKNSIKESLTYKDLKKGQEYYWLGGADNSQKIKYIGIRGRNPNIKVSSTWGYGFIFQWVDNGTYSEFGARTIQDFVKPINESKQHLKESKTTQQINKLLSIHNENYNVKNIKNVLLTLEGKVYVQLNSNVINENTKTKSTPILIEYSKKTLPLWKQFINENKMNKLNESHQGFIVVDGENCFDVEKMIDDRTGDFKKIKSFKYNSSGKGRDEAEKNAVSYANQLNKKSGFPLLKEDLDQDKSIIIDEWIKYVNTPNKPGNLFKPLFKSGNKNVAKYNKELVKFLQANNIKFHVKDDLMESKKTNKPIPGNYYKIDGEKFYLAYINERGSYVFKGSPSGFTRIISPEEFKGTLIKK